MPEPLKVAMFRNHISEGIKPPGLCYSVHKPPLSPAMLTTLLYLFTFSSWGLGLLAALTALSMKLQEHGIRMKGLALEMESDALDVAGKTAFVNRITGAGRPRTIPDELKKLIDRSPDHPEVSEIDEDDEVFGVLFKAEHYPPAMETDDD
jgi:hypothetical protein